MSSQVPVTGSSAHAMTLSSLAEAVVRLKDPKPDNPGPSTRHKA
jgi:hypothetical protein